MQASGSLSKSQILALESCFLFLRTLRPLLLSLGNELCATSREQLDGQIQFAQLNESRLVQAFPEVAAAQSRWQGGAS